MRNVKYAVTSLFIKIISKGYLLEIQRDAVS